MSSPEALELKAKLKTEDADLLAEQPSELEAQGLTDRAEAKYLEVRAVRDEAHGLLDEAFHLRQLQTPGGLPGSESVRQQISAAYEKVQEMRSRPPVSLSGEVGSDMRSGAGPSTDVNAEFPAARLPAWPAGGCADRHVGARSQGYIPRLKSIIGMGSADTEWVDTAREYPELLTLLGCGLLGFDFTGTAEALVADAAAIRDCQPWTGMHLLFVIREMITRCDVNSAQATLLLGNLLNPEKRPLVALTNLLEEWHIMWMDGNIIRQHPCASKEDAVGFIQEYLAGYFDMGEGALSTFATRRRVDTMLSLSCTDSVYFTRQIRGQQVRLSFHEAMRLDSVQQMHQIMSSTCAPL